MRDRGRRCRPHGHAHPGLQTRTDRDGKHSAASRHEHGGRGYESLRPWWRPIRRWQSRRSWRRAPVPEAAGTEYVVVKGDSFAKIAKKNGVSVKAIQAANPGVAPTKLKVGQKLSIPPGGSPAATSAPAGQSAVESTGGEAYTVKSGDTLTKIAKAHGTTVKAIKAASNLTTDHIKVGQKLTIPAKAEAAAPAPAPVPVAPAPASAPSTTPAPAGTPAGH